MTSSGRSLSSSRSNRARTRCARLSSAGVETWPPTSLHEYIDLYGNTCQRFVLGPGSVRIRYEAEVEVDSGVDEANETASQAAVADLPDATLHFTLASRYCESDTLSNTAWRLFGDAPPGWQRVKAVVDWVHDNVTFRHGSTVSATGATDVYLQRQGVCRDFAQLAVAFLRGLNIPARYCFGYLPDIDVPVHRAHGLRRLARGVCRRPLVHIRPAQQRAAHRPGAHRARS